MKKILIITSSGGGGLLQTAKAKEQEAIARHPNVQIVRRDVLKDWVPFSSFSINFWNKAQQKGDISRQAFCHKYQFIWDYMIFPIVFLKSLYTIYKENIDHVIDTQNLATSAIVKAIRVFNRHKRRRLRVEKVLVDLPTKMATHFFTPIKKLSKRDRRVFRLVSIKPLLDEGETDEQFWQSTCRLSADEIKLEEVYVRQAFQKYKHKERPTQEIRVPIQTKGEEELSLMQQAIQRGSIDATLQGDSLEVRIPPEDQMATVLLGSQPAVEATLKYVKKFIDLAREFPKIKTNLFVFCADHQTGEATLFRRVVEDVLKTENYPTNLSIIPFSFQCETVIAPLFNRSDITCTKSGGQTAMELICVSTGQVWIHSESKVGEPLLEGIPAWESASAVYLQKLHGAKIVTPDTIAGEVRLLYQTGNQPEAAIRALESTA